MPMVKHASNFVLRYFKQVIKFILIKQKLLFVFYKYDLLSKKFTLYTDMSLT
jgi:hypothetical protein